MKTDYGTYEILILNDDGHIIHHHYFDGFREEAMENAERSKTHWIGGPYTWKVIKIA